jgi:hypothetical protein
VQAVDIIVLKLEACAVSENLGRWLGLKLCIADFIFTGEN